MTERRADSAMRRIFLCLVMAAGHQLVGLGQRGLQQVEFTAANSQVGGVC